MINSLSFCLFFYVTEKYIFLAVWFTTPFRPNYKKIKAKMFVYLISRTIFVFSIFSAHIKEKNLMLLGLDAFEMQRLNLIISIQKSYSCKKKEELHISSVFQIEVQINF